MRILSNRALRLASVLTHSDKHKLGDMASNRKDDVGK